MHINSNGYALQNVSAKPYEPTGSFNINIQQKYELIELYSVVSCAVKYRFSFQFFQVGENEAVISSGNSDTKSSSYAPLVGIGKSYISDISLNPDYKRREFNQLNVEVENA